jgi:hypothetical protein
VSLSCLRLNLLPDENRTGLRIPPIGCHLRGDNNLLRKRNDSTIVSKQIVLRFTFLLVLKHHRVFGEEYEILRKKSPNLCDIGSVLVTHINVEIPINLSMAARGTPLIATMQNCKPAVSMKPSLLPFQLSRQKQIVAADRNFSRYK